MHDTQCIMGLSSWNLQVFLPWSQFYSSSCQHYIWTAGGGTVPNLSCVTEMTTVRMHALTDLIWNRAVRAPRSLNFWLTGIISCPHWLHWPLYLKLTMFDLSILKMGKMGENTKKICRSNINRNLLFLKRKRKKEKIRLA